MPSPTAPSATSTRSLESLGTNDARHLKAMSAEPSKAGTLSLRAVGGPTVVLEIGGLRLITDPTFDPPGSYDTGRGFALTKLRGPAIGPEELGIVDAALVSHEHHFDNLDREGRAYLAGVPRILTTRSGAARLGDRAEGLEPWDSTAVGGPGASLSVTAVPALHGPGGTEDPGGDVIGFVLQGRAVPTVYVSGDNASLAVVREIAGRLGKPDVAILHAGAAQVPPFGDALLTLNSEQSVEAARLLEPRYAVGVHVEGWKHLSEGPAELRKAFDDAQLGDRLVIPAAGETVVLLR
jgi:L-ascorbate metabolism protein UlaG (beta-lactamase superfamily)